MGKRVIALLLALCLWRPAAFAEEAGPAEYAFSGKVKRSYDSGTLKYTVERFRYERAVCFLTKIWMKDPGKQIRKATSAWKKNIRMPVTMVKSIQGAVLAINGSGYVSPTYPWIPEDYPGESEDYYYTPLGSLTVTDSAVFRKLDGVPYYGLTLEEDGLHMYVGEENEKVLARNPSQTWSFYVQCPMILENRDILPEEWDFAERPARRTVIARVDRNNYLILSVTNENNSGLTLRQVSRFFLDHFETEWVYNLDGGPSSALLCRARGKKKWTTVMGGKARDADVMAFTELP